MIWKLTVATLVAYPVTFLVVRLSGKKQISTMTFWDLVSAIALGSLAANIIISVDVPLYASVWVVLLWGGLAIGTGWLALKSRTVRGVAQGRPALVIANGQVVEEAMRRERLNMDMLLAELRAQGVFAISEVQFAVFEPTGKISVLKKSQSLPVTPKDLHTPTQDQGLSTPLIMDGTVLSENLRQIGLDQSALAEQLQARGINDLSEVFYAELGTDGSLYIDGYEDRPPTGQQH